jgi:hypothetical protein
MSLRTGRFVSAAGFIVLLADGTAAIWLGQVSGHPLLIVVGLALIAVAAGLALVYRRWRAALDDVAAARDALRSEIGALRGALDAARAARRTRG